MGKLRAWFMKVTAYRIAIVTGLLFIVGHCVSASSGGIEEKPVIGRLDLIFHDLKFQERGVRKPSGDVVIAAVDEKAIKTIGRWENWSRADQAQLLQRITDLGARAIVMDISWTDEAYGSTGGLARKFASRFSEISLAGSDAEPMFKALDSAKTAAESSAVAIKALKDGPLEVRDVKSRFAELPGEVTQLHTGFTQMRSKQTAFLESLQKEVGEVDPDAILSRTLGASGKVVLGSFLLSGGETAEMTPESVNLELGKLAHVEITRPKQASLAQLEDARVKNAPGVKFFEYAGARAPLGRFLQPDPASPPLPVAFFNTAADNDGVIRRTALVMSVKPTGADTAMLVPNLDLGGVLKYFGSTPGDVVLLASSEKHLDTVAIPPRAGKPAAWHPTPQDYLTVPVDAHGRLLLNYYGPDGTFPTVSLGDIWNGTVPKAAIDGKLVLYGVTATGTHDQRVTPFDEFSPGIEIHATSIENIIHHDFLQRPWWATPLELAVLLFLALGVGLLLTKVRVTTGFAVMLGTMLGYHLFDLVLFTSGIAVFSALPMLEILTIYVFQTIYRYSTEEREKAQIRRAFQFYLTKSVMEEMLKDPTKLKLGGEKKVCSVMFSDIRGFTTISERLSPEALAKLMNEYLTPMTNLVFETGGTLDKYIGDAVMAIWGAPILQEDHAYRSCVTAVAMMKELANLQERWRVDGRDYPPIDIGIGINSGPMVVGNMGADQRFDYTVLGDNVNLSSRLEGTNKDYRSHIIISQNTYAMCSDKVAVRQLGAVRVKGKKEPVKIYELLDDKPAAPGTELYEVITRFDAGLDLFRAQKFDEAIAKFKTVYEIWPNDGPPAAYIEFCEEYKEHPPGADWDGVYTMTHK